MSHNNNGRGAQYPYNNGYTNQYAQSFMNPGSEQLNVNNLKSKIFENNDEATGKIK